MPAIRMFLVQSSVDLDTEESDLDLLIDPTPQTTFTLPDHSEKFRGQVLAEAVSIWEHPVIVPTC